MVILAHLARRPCHRRRTTPSHQRSRKRARTASKRIIVLISAPFTRPLRPTSILTTQRNAPNKLTALQPRRKLTHARDALDAIPPRIPTSSPACASKTKSRTPPPPGRPSFEAHPAAGRRHAEFHSNNHPSRNRAASGQWRSEEAGSPAVICADPQASRRVMRVRPPSVLGTSSRP